MRDEIGYLKKVYSTVLNLIYLVDTTSYASSSTCTVTGTCKYPDMVLKFRFKFDAGTKFSTKFSTCTLCVCVAVKSLQCPKFRSRCLYLQVNVLASRKYKHLVPLSIYNSTYYY